EVEEFRDALLDDRRRKGAEALAVLDLQVELLLHFGMPGISEDAAVPQRPRTVFHPSLEPADDLPVGEEAGHLTAEPLEVVIGVAGGPVASGHLEDLPGSEFGTEQRPLHGVPSGGLPALA